MTTYRGFEIYPMPCFATLTVADPDASAAWYEAALGFARLFETPGPDGAPMLIHLRRHKYQDLLLVPARGPVSPAAPSSLTLSFMADGEVDALAERARAVPGCGSSSVAAPVDTPWNARDLVVVDPAGHRLVFTSRRAQPDPALAADWQARFDRGAAE